MMSALFDQSSYPIFWVDGEEALACMQHICANQMDVEIGQIVYTQWLNERRRDQADVTVTHVPQNKHLWLWGPAPASC